MSHSGPPRLAVAESNFYKSGICLEAVSHAPRLKFKALLAMQALLIGLPGPQVAAGLNVRDSLSQYGRQTWQTENGLPQDTVQAILQTRDGYIWLGTEGGLVRFDGLHFAVYDIQNTAGLKSNNIRTLAEDEEGSLWIGTAEGLTRYRDSAFQVFSADGELLACCDGETVRRYRRKTGGVEFGPARKTD